MIGQIINYRYEVLEKIGDGQIFSVFRSRDKVLNRLVALKVLAKDLSDNYEFAKAVRAGYSSVSSLNHPAIARVIEADPQSNEPFVACEYVRGINVKDRIERAGPMAVPLALDIIIAVLEGLQHAHDHGIAHGDLRPSDIVVSPDGEVKVTDFGLASALRKCPDVAGRYPMRSAYYQAPEVGEGAEPSVASDIYSAGVILYQMLTGSLPFDGPTPVAIALKQVKNEPAPPRELNMAVPKSLSDVIIRAIEGNPDDRFSDAVAMLNDLRAIRDALRVGKPLSIPQPVVSAKQSESVNGAAEIAEPSLKRPMIWLVLLFFVVFLSALGLTMYLQGTHGRAKVPQLLGKTLAEAKTEADKLGLTIQEDTQDGPSSVFSDTYNEGAICAVRPPADMPAPPDGVIRVKISKGPSRKQVPTLVGLPESEAYSAAQSGGFSISNVKEEYSDNVPVNSVVSQKPSAGSMETPGGTIQIIVSKGPKPESDQTDTGDTTGNVDNAAGADSANNSDNNSGQVRNLTVDVTVPKKGQDPQEVRIVVNDDRGETTVYQDFRDPGDRFSQNVTTYGDSPRIRVYVGDKLMYDEKP